MSDTLSYNIELDHENIIQDKKPQVDALIDMLGLNSYINSLSDSFETTINEHSTNISGGEKQKLSILRTLLKDPDVIIIDEPSSALDEASNNALKQYLQQLKEQKIIIIITHDHEFINISDMVVQMEKI